MAVPPRRKKGQLPPFQPESGGSVSSHWNWKGQQESLLLEESLIWKLEGKRKKEATRPMSICGCKSKLSRHVSDFPFGFPKGQRVCKNPVQVCMNQSFVLIKLFEDFTDDLFSGSSVSATFILTMAATVMLQQ